MLPVAVTEFEELFACLIHDLRQPLNTIENSASYLKLLLGDGGGAVEEQLRLIERQVDVAAHMLAEASARMRSGTQRAGVGAEESLDLTKSQTAVVT
jgi:signal transduction histidine kinase